MVGKEDLRNIGQVRNFGMLLSVTLALVAWSFLWKELAGGLIFSLSAFFLMVLTLFKPQLLKGLYRVWVRMAEVPARVMTNAMLTLLFFCVFTPVGMVARLLKIDFLDMKIPKNGSSYWEKSPDSYWVPKKEKHSGVERYEKQF